MSYSTEVLADNPLGYWRLNETSGSTAADSSGNGADLSIPAGPNLNVGGPTGDGSAIEFDGDPQALTRSDDAAFDALGSMTVEAWVYFDVLTGGSGDAKQMLLAKWDSGGDDGWFLARNGTNGIRWTTGGSNRNDYDVAWSPSTSTWYHVVATFDGPNDTKRVYVNGTEVGTGGTWTGTITANTSTIYAGNFSDNTWQLDGRLAELAVYDTALSEARIDAHYEAALSATVSLTTVAATSTASATASVPQMAYEDEVLVDAPVAFWWLDEASGTVAADSSGNSHPGTYTNSPTLGVAGPVPGHTAASFAGGSSQWVQIASDPALHVSNGTDPWTIEAWFKGASTVTDFGGPAILTVTSAGQVDFQFGFWNPPSLTDAPTIGYWNGSTDQFALSPDPIDDGAWHHLVGVFTGTVLRIYVDGTMKDDTTVTQNPASAGSQELRIARRWDDTGGVYLTGSIAAVAIYDTALSETRIDAHYAAISNAPISTVAATATVPAPSIGTPDARVSLTTVAVTTTASASASAVAELTAPDVAGSAAVPAPTVSANWSVAASVTLPPIPCATAVYVTPSATVPGADVNLVTVAADVAVSGGVR